MYVNESQELYGMSFGADSLPNVKIGDKRTGKVVSVVEFGAFLQIEEGFKEGLLHVGQMNLGPNTPASESEYTVGQELEVNPANFRAITGLCLA